MDLSPDPQLTRLTDLVHQLHNLRVFLCVAEDQSIAQAAKSLYKAPSAVSRSVVELEKTIGLPLFERSARGIILNDYGVIVLSRAKRIEEELNEAAADLARIRSRGSSASPSAITHMLFNGRKLELLIQLVGTRKISTAAARLNITQSGASMALSRIEAGLGAPLFQRGMQGIVATEQANRLAIRGKRVFAELRHLLSEIASVNGALAGTVVMGTLPLGRTHVFPMAIADAISKHSGIHVRTIDSQFDQLVAGLRCGDIDMILGVPRPDLDQQGLTIERLFTDRLTVVARADHPLAGAGALSLSDIRESRWILPWSGSPSRKLFEEMYKQAGMTPPVPAVDSADLAVVRQLLTASDALALVSARQMLFELRSGLVTELAVDLPGMTREVSLILREGALFSPVAQALLTAIRNRAEIEREAD